MTCQTQIQAGNRVRLWPAFLALLSLVAGCSRSLPVVPTVLVSQVVVAPAVDTLSVGGAALFTATVYDTSGNPISNTLLWSSGDPSIVSVSSGGVATGVGEGTTLVIATSGGKRDTAVVTVQTTGDWAIQSSSVSAELNGVFFMPDGRKGWAVGAGGNIVATQNAGATWVRQNTPTSSTLHGVWFTDAVRGWAVGTSGTVLHTVDGGTNWTRLLNVGQGGALMGVCFVSRDTGWVVGQSGLAIRTVNGGGSWQAAHAPTGLTLESVAFFNSQNGWAVGQGGVIAGTHDGGATWFTVPAVTAQPLKAVRRRSESVAYGVGAQGTVVRTAATPDSTAWSLANAGATHQLEGAHFPTDLIGYAVGFGSVGEILRTDDGGSTWENQVSHTGYPLNDVFFVDALRGWAVGQNGTIVHTSRGGKP